MADKQSGPNFSANWFLWAAIVGLSTYFVTYSELPIQGSRPLAAGRAPQGLELHQDVDARLWQDPFAAMWKDMAAQQKSIPQSSCAMGGNAKYPHSCPPVESVNGAFVIGVMLPGSPYPEAEESRRQIRYAVLSSLRTKEYVPDDEEHIGYFRTLLSDAPLVETTEDWPANRTDVAFELFRTSDGTRRVLIVWINEDELSKATSSLSLYGLAKLACRLQPTGADGPRNVAFLGPWASSTLRAMVGEVRDEAFPEHLGCRSPSETTTDVAAKKDDDGANRLTLYNYSATASEAELLDTAGSRDVTDYFDGHQVTYSRTIATDSVVADALAKELKLRGVNPSGNDHVVMISEWDSFYGRSLPSSLQEAFADRRSSRTFHKFNYMRGLDGQLPEAPATSSSGEGKSDAASDRQRAQDQPLARFEISKNIERPFGNGQYDYLRRLGTEIRQLDENLRRSGHERIRAVGVLGSDVYDKLAVLQLLRPEFPEAVFFTTDLDARLYHPAELSWTRNLIVASAYGLTVRDDLQGEIPPFRTTYQTSAFLTTKLALEDNDKNRSDNEKESALGWLNSPMLFEIGFTSPFAFALSKGGVASGPNRCVDDLRHTCESVAAPTPALFPILPDPKQWPVVFALWVGSITLGLLALGLFLSSRLRKVFVDDEEKQPAAKPPIAAALARDAAEKPGNFKLPIAIVLGLFAVVLVTCLYWPAIAGRITSDGAPIYLSSGISLWPSIAIQLFAVALSVKLGLDGRRKVDQNILNIGEKFGLSKSDPTSPKRDLAKENAEVSRWWKDVWRSLWPLKISTILDELVSYIRNRYDPTPNRIQGFWKSFVSLDQIPVRVRRMALATFAALLLWGILIELLGNPQPIVRGTALQWINDVVMGLAVFFTSSLILIVADATFVCFRFIKVVHGTELEWPAETAKKNAVFGLNETDLHPWIDLQLVAERTKCINKLVYYPFLVLALLIVSRSSFFNYYPPNWPMLIMAGIGSAIVLACAIALPWMAEQQRARAMEKVSAALVSSKTQQGSGPWAKPEQLEALLKRIEDFHEGAFTPLPQQPVVKALLLPLGGAGGTALLQYLVIPGFS